MILAILNTLVEPLLVPLPEVVVYSLQSTPWLPSHLNVPFEDRGRRFLPPLEHWLYFPILTVAGKGVTIRPNAH